MRKSRFTEEQIIKGAEGARGRLVGRRCVPQARHQRCGLRDECLNEHLFVNLNEARQIIEEWRIDYNTNRPHTSLNGLTPTEFAARPNRGQTQNGLYL